MAPKTLIFANGDIGDGPMARQALEMGRGAFAIAADGGLRTARFYDRKVDLIIGDLDSIDVKNLDHKALQGVEVRRFPQEKDETDLELALRWARQIGADWIRILGGIGGRLDQTLGNIYLLAVPELVNCDVRFVSGSQEAWLIYPGRQLIQGEAGDTVSLIPLSGSADGVRTDNLYYPLKKETLVFGPARGISNVMTASEAFVEFTSGLLLVVHTLGRA